MARIRPFRGGYLIVPIGFWERKLRKTNLEIELAIRDTLGNDPSVVHLQSALQIALP